MVITLPRKYDIQAGQEFCITRDAKGVITLISVITDFFKDAQPGEFVDEEDELARKFSPLQGEVDE
ncbi:AbrB family transcriptional regulator [Lacticaseibacillus zeae]|uniref:AbrB family transcriptional regulator n=1 Tax=Lacticaseibacillus zeae TaxID=57037 RepID=A0A5R8LNS9_LACZE|nr:AbrB family transcriptional regulator [Lacticaseibacillus zeae]TLF38843.1 AbrB family transcriptional regulator [Lacticaseibacillus zeae]